MRTVKFNKFERVAGLFVLVAILGGVATALSIAAKQGWFDSKVSYMTIFDNADGVHQGTLVQMAGLRAGSVESVELQEDNKIRVSFYIFGKFKDRIHQDSVTRLMRPFIIGERVLDISVGSEKSSVLAGLSQIPSVPSVDFIALLNGNGFSTYMGQLSGLVENARQLIDAMSDKGRVQGLVRTLDRVEPLIKNLNTMSVEVIKLSQQVTQDDGVQKLMNNLAITTQEINKILPELNKQDPALGQDLAIMMQNIAVMMNAMGPAIKAVEPQLPNASLRLVEALNETVVVLKAMEKNFFMRGSVKEVHEEEASRRLPANTAK